MTLDWKKEIAGKLNRPSTLKPMHMPPLPMKTAEKPVEVKPVPIEAKPVAEVKVEVKVEELAQDKNELIQDAKLAEEEAPVELKDDFVEESDKEIEIEKSNFTVIERDLLIINPVESIKKNSGDTHTIEWGRERNAGFVIGRVMHPTPMFFSADGHSVHLEDMMRGASIIISGPDVNSALVDRNAHVWAIGRAISRLKAHIWTAVSEPAVYDSTWANPSILKIVPAEYAQMKNKYGHIAHSPQTFYFRRHDEFSPQNFLFENSVYGPASGEFALLTVLRLAYLIGFRDVYLTGIKAPDRVKEIIKMIDPMFERNKFNVHDIDCGLSLKKASIDAAISSCIL